MIKSAGRVFSGALSLVFPSTPNFLSTTIGFPSTPTSLISPLMSSNSPIFFHSGLSNLRNIGISAHIDSGKTTLTERILFYTGRINAIHEVRGSDGVGATMDSMALEREKGITIQSAATYVTYDNHHFNIIDTPGHVDFTIEVERALSVLDGAIMIVCGASGVQSQTLTVDRQMKRYKVPRIIFINKLDRLGADPFRVVDQIRNELDLNAVFFQIPIGVENALEGVIDLVEMEALYFDGPNGEVIRKGPIPDHLIEDAKKYRADLIDEIAGVDEEFAEHYLEVEDAIDVDQFHAAARRATIAFEICPVFMGSAFKNKGVQPLLDSICMYLPNPAEVENTALDLKNDEERVKLIPEDDLPLVCLAFKLEQSRFGQLTYVRVYQGTLSKGMSIQNPKTGETFKVPRVIRMHSDEMEDVSTVGSGEICALFGIDCASGDTFTDGKVNYSMTTMFVPEPVMSISIKCKNRADQSNFGKALNRFQKEDPTFRITVENEETIMSGMGELHLEIYRERLLREYNVETEVSPPQVAYRECPGNTTDYDYLHKKQSGGRGQFAHVIGYIEPIEDPRDPEGVVLTGGKNETDGYEFVNSLIGNTIPPGFLPGIEKGFLQGVKKGALTGSTIANTRIVLTDGNAHVVDSSELSFAIASQRALEQAMKASDPIILEPIMNVELTGPREFQSAMTGLINKKNGMISDQSIFGNTVTITSETPLAQMFGFSTSLRSGTQGKGEFTMEYVCHKPVPRDQQEKLMKEFESRRKQEPE